METHRLAQAAQSQTTFNVHDTRALTAPRRWVPDGRLTEVNPRLCEMGCCLDLYHEVERGPLNVLRDGLAPALRRAQRHECGDCWSAYLNERKLVFGLRPRALLEMARRG